MVADSIWAEHDDDDDEEDDDDDDGENRQL